MVPSWVTACVHASYMTRGGLLLRAFRTYFLIVAISLAVSLYLSEGYLRYEIKEAKRSVLLAAEQAGYPIDRRTKVDVIDDLRSSGEDAWPLISPGAFVSEIGSE